MSMVLRYNNSYKIFVVFCLSLSIKLVASSEERVFYSGDSIQFDNAKNLTILKGNASVRKGNSAISAKTIVFDRKINVATATGNVKFFNTKEGISGDSIVAKYDLNKKYIILDGGPQITDSSNKVSIAANSIHVDSKTGHYYAYTNVVITDFKTEDVTTIKGDHGKYINALSYFKMTSNCNINTSDVDAVSVFLEYYQNSEKVILTKDVFALLKDGDNVTNELTADKIEIIPIETNKQLKNYFCYSNVSLYNTKENTIVSSHFLKYNPDTKYAYMSGSPVLSNIESKMVLKAVTFERFEKDNILYAKGNVSADMEGTKAYSSIAVYMADLGKSTLFGAPYIEQEKQRFYAERIIFYLDEKKILMENQIVGSLYEN